MRWRGRQACGTALACALAAALPCAARAAATQVSSDPYSNAGSQHRTEVEPDTFSNGSTLVGAFQVGRFADGGASNIGWVRAVGGATTSGFLPATTGFASPAGPYSRVSDPSVAYDAAHGVWLIASLAVGSSVTGVAVIVSRSTDGGTTWSGPVPVTTASGSADLDKEWVACDDTATSPHYGSCYAAWDDHGDADRLKMSVSRDGGATWSAGVGVGGGATGFGTQPVVGPDGAVIVPAASADDSRIISFRSTDGGASWGAPVTVAAISDHPPAGNMRAEPLPSAEIDGAGRVYVAWHDCRFRAECASNDIVISTSDDGVNWSAPARVPIDAATSGADHFIAGLAVDPTTAGASARLALTYYFYPQADCTESTCQLDAGQITSSDGGAAWSAPTQVAGPMNVTWLADTSQGFMVGDYISTSFVDGAPEALIAAAGPPSGGALDEAAYGLGFGEAAPPSPPPSTTAGESPGESAPAAGAPSASPARASARPRLTGLRLAPTTFLAARSGPSIARAPGTRVSYRSLVRATTTTFRVERLVRGRWRRVRGSFAHRDRPGLNAFRFTGRVAHRRLAAGRYRLIAVPRSATGARGASVRVRFRILAPVRRRGRRTAR